MSKTIKQPKPEDLTIRWLHKSVNADGTVANGTYNAGKNDAKYSKALFDKAFRREMLRARKAKRG